MAINPMQRKARNSFLAGFFISLIIGVAIAYFFYSQMNKAKKDYADLKALQREVYIATEDLKSGDEIMLDELAYEYEEENDNNDKNENSYDKVKILEKEWVQTTLSEEQFIDSSMFKYDYKENPKSSEDDGFTKVYKKLVLKIDVPAGTVITKDMVEEIEQMVSSDQRIQEYNMIVLPTLLKEEDYIDIRLKLPNGEDFVVASRKKVYKATNDTIWIKVREDEILTIGCAIVEAYTIPGSKLYATIYTEPGRQDEAKITYSVNDEVLALIEKDQNIIVRAANEIREKYYDQRANSINSALAPEEERGFLVETKNQEEITKLQTSRQEYVESLGGGTVSE